MPYIILEHPSDIGIKATGKNLLEAFESVALGMMSVLIDAKDVCDAEEKIINVSADDIERLVVKWLSEILFLFDSEGFITSSVRIQSINATSISASLKGERINLAKHHFKVDIKAITYHQLRVTVTPQDTEIVVFFDI